MRTLPALLESQQQKAIGTPAAQVVIDDRFVGVFRPRWATYVTDSVPDGPTDIAMCYDGSILRARVDPATGILYTQRITNVATLSQWTTWTQLATGVHPTAQIALAWDGYNTQAICYVLADARSIRAHRSTSNGASWGNQEIVNTLATGHTCTALAATLNSGNETLYVLNGDNNTTDGTATITITQTPEDGLPWIPLPTTFLWTGTITGLAVDGIGPYLRTIITAAHGLYAAQIAPDTLAFTGYTTVLPGDNPDVTFTHPAVALNFDQHYYIFYLETNSATAVTRLHHVIAANWDTISLFPRPYNLSTAYGVCAMADINYHYLCSANTVYRAPVWTPSASQRINVAGDILNLSLTEHLTDPGQLYLALRNDDGRYASELSNGAYQAIKRGSQISVRLGYTVSGADLVSFFQPFWVQSITDHRAPGASTLRLYAVNLWGILHQTKAPRLLTWTNATIRQILTHIIASLGPDVADDSNAVWDTVLPTFTILPGQELNFPIMALLRSVGGVLVPESDPDWEIHWPSIVARLKVPAATNTYTYGAAHVIKQGDYTLTLPTATHLLAYGADTSIHAHAYDHTTIELLNADRLTIHVDRRTTTNAQAATLAANVLRPITQATKQATITTPPNVTQELTDIVTVQDSILALNDTYAVLDITTVLDRSKRPGLYEQTLTLGAPTWT